MQRIEEFLNENEVPDWASSLTASREDRFAGEVGFSAATFEWPSVPKSPSPSRFQLGPLDVIFPKGELTLISGATGSGKTALLGALLGGQSCILEFPPPFPHRDVRNALHIWRCLDQ